MSDAEILSKFVDDNDVAALLAERYRLRAELANRDARIAALETAGEELHKCLAAMVDRWEPDTEGLDRVMWENSCEALGREIWAHLKTT